MTVVKAAMLTTQQQPAPSLKNVPDATVPLVRLWGIAIPPQPAPSRANVPGVVVRVEVPWATTGLPAEE